MSEKQINSTNLEISPEDKEMVTENTNTQASEKIEESETSTSEFDQHILGEYLRSLRVENNISLKQLSIDTKINESVLQNLEDQKFESLPRKIYLQGFIKTYCQYFKQDSAMPWSYWKKSFIKELQSQTCMDVLKITKGQK